MQSMIILYGKNLFNTIGYDSGASGTRLSSSIDVPTFSATGALSYTTINYIQGVNGPAGFNRTVAGSRNGIVSSYSVTPPRTFGVEFHYKFF